MTQALLATPDVTTGSTFRGEIQQPTLVLMHILAGRSILTLRSRRTSERMTFKFSRPDLDSHNQYAIDRGTVEAATKPRPIWVHLYGGPASGFTQDDTDRRNWKMLGTMWPGKDGGSFEAKVSRKCPLPADHLALRVFAWMAQRLPARVDELLEQGQWWHEGSCGRCGRRLTVPDSIQTGFGPECRKEVGL